MSTALHAKALGRNTPPDFEHVEKYPLTAVPAEQRPVHVPVVPGTNWYTCMDTPVRGTDGRWRIDASNPGSIRGGHCYCLEPPGEPDPESNHIWYDQDGEPACEGFGHSRAMSLLKKEEFDAFWLYDDARRAEGTYPEGEGAYNRSTCAALKLWGDHPDLHEYNPDVIEREPWRPHVPAVGIASYHWATTIEEVLATLGFPPSTGEVPILNSWGRDGYPHRVYVPGEFLQRLINEEGEVSVLIPH